ncbi:poly-beta-1,6-N-acetyl-D-glucosamine synthase [Gammaproteobacteria bacterium]
MQNQRPLPVFFDPDNRRWPRLRLAILLVGIILSVLAGFLMVSILANPILPALPLPNSTLSSRSGHGIPPRGEEHHITKAKRALKEVKARLEREQEHTLAQLLLKARAPHHKDHQRQPLIFGYYVNWDDASFSSLKENLDHLDVLIPEWLHLSGADGSLREDEPMRQRQVTQYIRNRYPNLSITPLINNWNGAEWDGAQLARLLENSNAREKLIHNLLEYLERNNFQGLSIDFEDIPSSAQPEMLIFMSELYAATRPKGFSLSLSVPALDPQWHYQKYAKVADFLIVMAYDEHWSSGSAGPIASMGWFAQALVKQQTEIPPDKLVVGMANYAYDWPPQGPAQEKTFGEAILTAKKTDAIIRFDPEALNPYFDYEEGKTLHRVWILDAVSLFNQLVTADALHPRGYALWRLGSEDPAIWNILDRNDPLNETAAISLEEMKFGYALDYEGQGEILRVASQPHAGERNIRYDEARGLIVNERFSVYPSPYVISRHGYSPRNIALTFDDGPDPEWTPAILDVLKSAGIPATFFIIGSNAQQHPDLLRRMFDEGHEIGNHTFTHPNIATIPTLQFQLELSATQRMLESVIGRQTRLFRAPYAMDSEPETPDEIHPLEVATEHGYFTVGMKIDPNDWQRPSTDEIVRRVVEDAEKQEGNIVLLHDSGGDRTQTVEAIPRLVQILRSHGFQFVTVAELLGYPRDDMMPLLARNSLDVWADRIAFAVVEFSITVVHWLFLAGIILGVGRLLFIGALAVVQRLLRTRRVFDPDYNPSVAVILPAYNEAKVINQTIASLLASTHPEHFEIIVVDDGSTDDTFQIVQKTFADEPRVRVYSKENGGKASALNTGIAHTQAEVVVALDADTVFSRDTISLLVRHFHDPRVGAVAGNAKVGNRTNLLTRWQALEYITSQNLDRRAFDVLNCITVVPGAVGAWRRELVVTVDGFSDLTLAEDADLTLAIRRLGYTIRYEDSAIALTEAPSQVRGFIRQRYRWMYGTMQAAWRHRAVLFRPRYGSLGVIALPNIIVFQVIFPLISPLMDLLFISSLVLAGFDWWQHPDQFSNDGLQRILFYYSLFLAIDFLAAVLAFSLEHREDWSLLLWLFWQRFFYRQLMYYVAIKSTMASLKGIVVGWNKLERTATVKSDLF